MTLICACANPRRKVTTLRACIMLRSSLQLQSLIHVTGPQLQSLIHVPGTQLRSLIHGPDIQLQSLIHVPGPQLQSLSNVSGRQLQSLIHGPGLQHQSLNPVPGLQLQSLIHTSPELSPDHIVAAIVIILFFFDKCSSGPFPLSDDVAVYLHFHVDRRPTMACLILNDSDGLVQMRIPIKERSTYRNAKIDCNSGKIKPIEQLSEREKRAIRKKWKSQKRKDRSREKEVKDILNSIHTPPSSPEHESAEIHISSRQGTAKEEKTTRGIKIIQPKAKDATRNKQSKAKILIEAIREKYRHKSKQDKADFAKFLCGRTLKKYNLKTETYKSFGYHYPKKNKVKQQTLTKRISAKVHAFYIRNDKSRLIPGKRQTKTLKKIRKQRRVLLFDIKTLHKKFLSEGKTKTSYSVFCRLRPFFVVFPRHSDRNTCMCKVCNNTELMTEALKRVSPIESADLNTCIGNIVCSTNEKDCMYGECKACRERSMDVNKDVLGDDVQWFEWNTKREVRTIKKGKDVIEKAIHITEKEMKNGNVNELVDKFEDQLKRYTKHIFRTYNQYQYFAKKKIEIKEDECLLHVDFSENYVCGYTAEVQSVHFGASKRQITLHTGVAIVKDQPQYTFCTVSDSLVHGPEAVWAHLKPILTKIKTKYPKITKLEIFSDGPVTQYRQKGNFYLASVKGKEFGFDDIKWSFFEAGHGKGVPGAIEDSNVKMYLVKEECIEEERTLLKNTVLKPVPGTLNLHQVICDIKEGKIAYRHLSCLCKIDSEHKGHEYCSQHYNTNNNEIRSHQPEISSTQRKRKLCNTGKGRQDVIYYEKVLQNLNLCQTFEEIKHHLQTIPEIEVSVKADEINVYQNKLEVDTESIVDIQDDLKMPDYVENLYPVEVNTDGNFLPSCGSVYAFGNPDRPEEIRTRIIKELSENESYYLNNENLLKGSVIKKNESTKNLSFQYAQYSEYFIPGMHLTQTLVRDIFQKGVMSLTENKSFMGIWQVFALSTIL
ncbi:hypothetical protein MAR_034004 [Mya arenaria]|uniref:Uncharacterized protein n=1 Tax=Mya arenaria TaxID=6604 RepID=A0ABY7GAL3_MYAAR|nr:hypothetical protein MAR_034004 [Mya arenaria]